MEKTRQPSEIVPDLEYLARDFWSKVGIRNGHECWHWQQSTGSHGYGQTWDGQTVLGAHRVAWALHNNRQVPKGMTVDHKCHVKTCCNPGHLQLMTNEDNARKNLQADKTHCPKGHPYSGLNLYVCPNGHRRCRACADIRQGKDPSRWL